MTLHPILALDQVIEEYRDYLRTEFRAKDPALKEALERELDQPLFLAQEPFFQAHRPFRPGKRWDALPLDPRLARVMTERARRHGAARPEYAFLHQSDAIENLLAPDPRPRGRHHRHRLRQDRGVPAAGDPERAGGRGALQPVGADGDPGLPDERAGQRPVHPHPGVSCRGQGSGAW